MTVLFICGCLEIGKDGVGDYSRILAANLIDKHKIKAYIVALNDKYVIDNRLEIQNVGKIDVEVFRLSKTYTYRVRFNQLAGYICKIKPNVASLQFVPYTFDEKGLPLKLPHFLSKLNVSKWHIMFHELWAGMEKNSSHKTAVIGYFQKKIIKRLIKILAPKNIHTSNKLYLFYLNNFHENACASILPLFSNIHNTTPKKKLLKDLDNTFKIVIFGSIHSGAPIQQFINWLLSELQIKEYRPYFYFIGNNGMYLSEWTKHLTEANVGFEILNYQTDPNITNFLRRGHLGVTTTPFYLADKSGTVAAMIQNNLPVLCVAKNWLPKVPETLLKTIRSQNCEYWNDSLCLQEILKKKKIQVSIDEVGNLFLKNLRSNG